MVVDVEVVVEVSASPHPRSGRSSRASDGRRGEQQGNQQQATHRHMTCRRLLESQLEASHWSDSGVKTSVSQSDKHVHRKQKFALQVYFQTRRQRHGRNSVRQRDDGLGRHDTGRNRRVGRHINLATAKDLFPQQVDEQGDLRCGLVLESTA